MFIPRDLGIHSCWECKKELIDSAFTRSGIYLEGEFKWQAFFEYLCPYCSYNGSYRIKPNYDSDDLPGDMFRQFGDAIDEYFRRNSGEEKINLDGNVDDFLKNI